MGAEAARAVGSRQRPRDSRRSLREYFKVKVSHAAGTRDLTIHTQVSQRSSSASPVARKVCPVSKLSMPRVTIPAKKHHLVSVGFLVTTLAKARSRLKVPAA